MVRLFSNRSQIMSKKKTKTKNHHSRVWLWYSGHILSSTVIHYCTDPWQHEIYLCLKVKSKGVLMVTSSMRFPPRTNRDACIIQPFISFRETFLQTKMKKGRKSELTVSKPELKIKWHQRYTKMKMSTGKLSRRREGLVKCIIIQEAYHRFW